MPRVFVAYAREDWTAAKETVKSLRGFGLDVFWDEDHHVGRWSQRLREEVRRADHFVWLMSPNSVRSVEVSKEYGITSDRNVSGYWRTHKVEVGEGKEATFRILQDQDGVELVQEHDALGVVLLGRGLITYQNTLKIWFRTITGAEGEMALALPGASVTTRGVEYLEGTWSTGHGVQGALVLRRAGA